MPDVEETPSRHDLEAKIIKHSWDDPAFREKFIADPKGTIAKYTGLSAGSLPEIVVHEEKVGTWHIVLPVKPADAQELSDADLEKVAGGDYSDDQLGVDGDFFDFDSDAEHFRE